MGLNPLEVHIKGLSLRTPLMTASGTSGTSDEVERLRRSERVLQSLGAFVTKGVTLEPRPGNPELRVIETRTGLLNSIGLQNSGAVAFVARELPRLLLYKLHIIVNISAGSVREFGRLASFLVDSDVNRTIAGIEINVSCPNISAGGVAFGVDPRIVERVVKTVKKAVGDRVVVITKLTPNVTDITRPARAAINGGTDALSMINTIRGMAINVETGKPFLANVVGGLSGPAIKPVGVFMVYECFRAIPECRDKRIPIIGIGGITIWQDAMEYIMAGATAVGIGTAWFVNPDVVGKIKEGLAEYLRSKAKTIEDLVGYTHKVDHAPL
jgi:dihydroorotate dehydrogenase (NAD+) catalytic subunit